DQGALRCRQSRLWEVRIPAQQTHENRKFFHHSLHIRRENKTVIKKQRPLPVELTGPLKGL
ncbi:MAG TPA: hypothetical protein VJ904_11170, partial [Tichowtungia sp.]|nr:hypothetical protein [Tichowtungia sp.]